MEGSSQGKCISRTALLIWQVLNYGFALERWVLHRAIDKVVLKTQSRFDDEGRVPRLTRLH